MSVTLRPVCADDCALTFEWANDPVTRAMSFSSDPIEWDTHTRWFDAQLGRPRSLFLMAEHAGAPVGQIRFACDATDPRFPNAVVGVSVAPGRRGAGLGTAIVRAGVARVAEEALAPCVDAYIKPVNTASLRLFERAGFGERADVTYDTHPAVRMTWRA